MDAPTNIARMERQRLHVPDVPDAPIERPSVAADRLEAALLDTGALPRFAAKALLCILEQVIDSTADLESDLLAALWQSLDDPREAGWALQTLMRAEIAKYASNNYAELIQPLELWDGEE
jgi:hypothetical protein